MTRQSEYNSTTTLRRIWDADPFEGVWRKLLAHLDKTAVDDEPLPLLIVLDINGLDDALWVLAHAMPDDRLARHFQARIADRVLHLYEREYPNDPSVRDQIAMLRNDDASPEERDAGRAAARAAVRIAASDAAKAALYARNDTWTAKAAMYAASAAVENDVIDAASDAVRAAAWAAADRAKSAADNDAVSVAARTDQERKLREMIAQEAAQ